MPELEAVPVPFLTHDQIVRLAACGHARCTAHLLSEYRPLTRIIHHMRREIDPASVVAVDEMVAVARLAALEALRTYDPDRGAAFTTHAFWPMRRAMMNAARASGSARPAALAVDERVDDTAGDAFIATEERIDAARRAAPVRRWVASLPPGQRAVVHAHFWDAKTHTQIAAERAISRQAVSKAIAGALASGREHLVAVAA